MRKESKNKIIIGDMLRQNLWGMLWTSLVAMQFLSYPREREGFHDCSPITSLIWVKQPFESSGIADTKNYFDFFIKSVAVTRQLSE